MASKFPCVCSSAFFRIDIKNSQQHLKCSPDIGGNKQTDHLGKRFNCAPKRTAEFSKNQPGRTLEGKLEATLAKTWQMLYEFTIETFLTLN